MHSHLFAFILRLVQVAPVPLAEVVSQLSGSAFTASPIGQQLAEAKSNGDAQSFAPLLLSTVQLLQTRSNTSSNGSAADQAVSRSENTQVRALLLQSVKALSDNTFATVDSLVQQAQMVTSLAADPKELNPEFRQVLFCCHHICSVWRPSHSSWRVCRVLCLLFNLA